MPKILSLTIEACGCPTYCMHCWAQGGAYQPMPIDDIAWVLEQAQSFCSGAGLALDASAMHEMLAHPAAAELLTLLQAYTPHDDHSSGFEPLITTGVPLALREDWRELLQAARAVGANTLWLAFHGIGEVHDRVVNRRGAFREVCLAIERARSMGIGFGCNVFLTKENAPQALQLAGMLQEQGVADMSWEVARYHCTARSRRHEAKRPTLAEPLPLREWLAQLSINREFWQQLEAHTEAAYVQQALQEPESFPPRLFEAGIDWVSVVCRGDFEVYGGQARTYGPRCGNLKRDGAEQVFTRALALSPFPYDSLYFTLDAFPPVRELAAKYGDPQGSKVYYSGDDMVSRWLDLALAPYRKY